MAEGVVKEPAACAAAKSTASNRARQMGLSGASSADQHDISLLGKEAAGGKIADQCLIDWRALEVEVCKVLGEWQLGNGELYYLIERASFSATSALRSSPMIRCGSWRRFRPFAMTSSKAPRMPKSFNSPMRSRISVRSIRPPASCHSRGSRRPAHAAAAGHPG